MRPIALCLLILLLAPATALAQDARETKVREGKSDPSFFDGVIERRRLAAEEYREHREERREALEAAVEEASQRPRERLVGWKATGTEAIGSEDALSPSSPSPTESPRRRTDLGTNRYVILVGSFILFALLWRLFGADLIRRLGEARSK